MPQPTRRVIVDGPNLTMRALSVPALAKLRDRRGRPTGVLHGVLRSAVSVRKAYPSARVTFVWDGSRRRRASVYEGYKRSRPTSGSGQDVDVLWLTDTLPLLYDAQAWSDVAEADDVVATLVRRDDDETVIFSTDRDFLQLVTARVHVLSPPPKSVLGRGKLYDVARVRQEYGVAPWAMVLLRAVVGDVSDDLHGVPGVGLKIASRLWNMVDRVVLEREHQGGCVECDLAAVDRSLDEIRRGAAGLTKLQAKRILDAEDVVKRNVRLMTLVRDVDVDVVPPRPDPEALARRLSDVDLEAVAKATKPRSDTGARQTSFLAA